MDTLSFSVLGMLGFIFSLSALAKVRRLESRLKELKVLDDE